jgi:general secretion pathway protein F
MEFRVKALDNNFGVSSHVLSAVDELDARRQLELRDLKIISLTQLRRSRILMRPAHLHLAVFSQQLVALLDAGLSLVESLEALAERESNSGTHQILQRVLGRLYEGQTLATALAEQPLTFPALYVASVRASERTGALREALTRYIAYAEQADALRKTLVNACIYPAVLLGVGLLVTLFLLGYVVPRFSAIYEDVGTDLPTASRVLLQWGQLMDAHGGLMALGLTACLLALGYALSRPATRTRVGMWIAAIPAVGHQLHVYQLARLYRTTGMLLRGGMPAVAALEMSAGLLRTASRQAYAAATQAVREGQSLAQAMESNGLTTAVATRMLRVGERSGNMGEMMERIAAFCDEELARWVAVVTRLIEPLLMTVIGLVIGVIVVLMYFPIFQLAGSIR